MAEREGPIIGATLDADYAACNGKAQSPIDIEATRKAALPALKFESKSAPLRYLVNNGYTIRVNYHDAPGTGNFLTVGDERYQLTQFHFHRPSEEYLHGKPSDMVGASDVPGRRRQGCRDRGSPEGGQGERDHPENLGPYAQDGEPDIEGLLASGGGGSPESQSIPPACCPAISPITPIPAR